MTARYVDYHDEVEFRRNVYKAGLTRMPAEGSTTAAAWNAAAQRNGHLRQAVEAAVHEWTQTGKRPNVVEFLAEFDRCEALRE